MKKLLIVGYKNVTTQGLILVFNEKVSLNGRLATNEWWLSWDKIGEALFPDSYCDISEIVELKKLRGEDSQPQGDVEIAEIVSELENGIKLATKSFEKGLEKSSIAYLCVAMDNSIVKLKALSQSSATPKQGDSEGFTLNTIRDIIGAPKDIDQVGLIHAVRALKHQLDQYRKGK